MEFEGKNCRVNGIDMNVVVAGEKPDGPVSGDMVIPDLRWLVGGSLAMIFLLVGWVRAAGFRARKLQSKKIDERRSYER